MIKEAVELRAQRRTRILIGMRGYVAQLVLRGRIQEIQGVILEGGPNSGLPHQRPATLHQRGATHILSVAKGRDLALEFPFDVLGRVGHEAAFRKVKREKRDDGNDEHDRREQPRAKARNACNLQLGDSAHGKSTRRVASPGGKSTSCSRMVLLSTHAFTVKRPAGKPASLKPPAASVITKCGVASTRMSARMCS